MSGRILVVEESRPVVAALRKALEAAGFRVDASSFASAADKHDPDRHVTAVVRAATGARQVVAALRRGDRALAVVALFEDEADADPASIGADVALVGPLSAPAAVASVCALAARAREQARRISDLERREAPPADRDLDFLKRLLFFEVRRSRRYRFPVALALVAIDGWPEAAARLGGRARARILGDLLATLAAAVRDIDVAVAFTEDRFVVLMPHTDAEGALAVSRRLCQRVRERGGTAPVSASVGVAAHEGDGPVSFSALVQRATAALARAREAGGDRVEGDLPRRRVRALPG